jgi:hypothetical protein
MVVVPISARYRGRFAAPWGAFVMMPVQAERSVAMAMATRRNTTMIATSPNSTFSRVLKTTGERVIERAIASRNIVVTMGTAPSLRPKR